MLETERSDDQHSGTPHHSENDGSTGPAGLTAPSGGPPAAGGDAGRGGPAGTDSASAAAGTAVPPDAAGGSADGAADATADSAAPARRARRPRRAATRAAGPPPEDLAAAPVSAPVVAPPAASAVPVVPPAVPAAVPPSPAASPASPPAVPPSPAASPASAPAVPSAPVASAAPAVAGPLGIPQATFQPPPVIFQPPAADQAAERGNAARAEEPADEEPGTDEAATEDTARDASDGSTRRRRRRGGRGRGQDGDGDAESESAEGQRPGGRGGSSRAARAADGAPQPRGKQAESGSTDDEQASGTADSDEARANGEDDGEDDGTPGSRRRRRRRRRGSGTDAEPSSDDPPNTVVHVRVPRAAASDEPVSASDVKSVRGSTRLEAKRQRRREGRESGRRRPPVISESEFLARRESVDRVMVVRQLHDRTQIAVLEDGVLVEHYVDKATHQSMVGNVYLGKVQNVLPSMEAAFVDVGKGRNAVLYAGEVNFDASGLEGDSKRIESALKSGQSVLVQVTKDPVGHKGARLTSQVSLPGRYLVYVPGGAMMGISRKLPDKERTRLKQILKQVMPDGAGVIVRTAAEGATEEELSRDVARLSAQWEAIEQKSKTASAPELLYSEPDLTIRVVRDIFNEDFASLVVAGDEGWDLVHEYVRYVAPHLADRLTRWSEGEDVFAQYRIDEQLAKALERKVWLPSGGSLVIDNTEAMTVVDVNTGKFTGQGGNLEETVTRNNLEAAEEMVRQLRLRDVGGIIVIDFIDMVLESNRELVLRRMLECLARDRTKHQVAEVTSLGLVQMTRKRVGSGLLEAFSEPCDCCNGRGRIISLDLTEPGSVQRGRGGAEEGRQAGGRGDRNGRQDKNGRQEANGQQDRGGRQDRSGQDRSGTQGSDGPGDRNGPGGRNGRGADRDRAGAADNASGSERADQEQPAAEPAGVTGGAERSERAGGRRRRRSGSGGQAAAQADAVLPPGAAVPMDTAVPEGSASLGEPDLAAPAGPALAGPALAAQVLPMPDEPAPGDHLPPQEVPPAQAGGPLEGGGPAESGESAETVQLWPSAAPDEGTPGF
jgi:ribonuclease E